MYMGNTTAKSRGDVAGGGYPDNNSKPHKPSSIKNKRNVEHSLRVSVLINEAHKNCPKGPPVRKFKEDVL